MLKALWKPLFPILKQTYVVLSAHRDQEKAKLKQQQHGELSTKMATGQKISWEFLYLGVTHASDAKQGEPA